MPDSRPVTVTCGIDRTEKHHDVALLDKTGKPVAERRISDDADGWRVLVELLTNTAAELMRPAEAASDETLVRLLHPGWMTQRFRPRWTRSPMRGRRRCWIRPRRLGK